MTTMGHETRAKDGSAAPLSQWLRPGLTVLAVAALALGGVVGGLTLALRLAVGDVAQLALALALSGGGSLVAGVVALRLIAAPRVLGVRVKFAIPAALAAVVVAINTFVAAQQMFISYQDSTLLFGFLAFGLVLALALSSTAAESLARALRRVELGARRVARGDYAFRLSPHSSEGIQELGQLAESFNVMAGNIQEAFARRDAAETQRATMLAALSHDMRTPLAITRALIESIEDGIVDDPTVIARYHRNIHAELRRLSALVEDIFLLARLEAGSLRLECARIDPGDLISDHIEALRELAARRDVTISGAMTPGAPPIVADARQIARVLSNALRNALRHTPPGGQIRLLGRVEDAWLIVEVADSGEGIAPADLPHVFEPAFRGEVSRRRHPAEESAAEGGGFGLTIARGIVTAHGGLIEAISPLPPATLPDAAGPGTLIRVRLPVAGPAAAD